MVGSKLLVSHELCGSLVYAVVIVWCVGYVVCGAGFCRLLLY